MGLQLEPALVVLILRLKKRPGLACVDQHGKFQPAAQLEDLVETRIVDVNALLFAVLQLHAEILENLQTLRAVIDIFLQLSGGAGGIIRIVEVPEIDIGEYHEAVLEAPLLRHDHALEPNRHSRR